MCSSDLRTAVFRFNESSPMNPAQPMVYVRTFPGADGKWQVSTGGGDSPVWSRKSQELFFRNSNGIMVASHAATGDTFTASKPRLWAEKRNLTEWFDLAPEKERGSPLARELQRVPRPDAWQRRRRVAGCVGDFRRDERNLT